MKKLLSLSILVILSAIAITGCGTIDKAYNKVVSIIPAHIVRTNTTYVTNVAILPSYTDPAGVVIPAQTKIVVQPTVTYDYAPEQTATNLVANPSVQGITQIVGAAPFPFAGTASIALGFLYSAYAAIRNKKLNVALVQGIEAGRQVLQTTPEGQSLDKKVKDLLISHQEAAGVLNEASKLVNEYTHNTVA